MQTSCYARLCRLVGGFQIVVFCFLKDSVKAAPLRTCINGQDGVLGRIAEGLWVVGWALEIRG